MTLPYSPNLVPMPPPLPHPTAERGLSGRKQGSWDILHSHEGDARPAAAEQVILVVFFFFKKGNVIKQISHTPLTLLWVTNNKPDKISTQSFLVIILW